MLIGKIVEKEEVVPATIVPLLEEFKDLFPEELPDELPPLCDI